MAGILGQGLHPSSNHPLCPSPPVHLEVAISDGHPNLGWRPVQCDSEDDLRHLIFDDVRDHPLEVGHAVLAPNITGCWKAGGYATNPRVTTDCVIFDTENGKARNVTSGV